MRQTKRMASWGILFFCMFVSVLQRPAFPAPSVIGATHWFSASSSAGQAGVNQYSVFCESDPEQPVIYFSDLFDVASKIQGRGADVAVARQVEPAFISFLKEKYSFKSSASCTTGGRPQSEAAKDSAKAYVKSQNKKIIETGWKYTAE